MRLNASLSRSPDMANSQSCTASSSSGTRSIGKEVTVAILDPLADCGATLTRLRSCIRSAKHRRATDRRGKPGEMAQFLCCLAVSGAGSAGNLRRGIERNERVWSQIAKRRTVLSAERASRQAGVRAGHPIADRVSRLSAGYANRGISLARRRCHGMPRPSRDMVDSQPWLPRITHGLRYLCPLAERLFQLDNSRS
jgi:hypothetical protein